MTEEQVVEAAEIIARKAVLHEAWKDIYTNCLDDECVRVDANDSSFLCSPTKLAAFILGLILNDERLLTEMGVDILEFEPSLSRGGGRQS